MKKILPIIVILTLALVGCNTHKQVQNTLPPVVLNNSDSVRVETIIKTIYVPMTVGADIPQQSETNVTPGDSSHVETDIAESDAWLNGDGTLGHTIKNKPGTLPGKAYVPMTTEQTTAERIKWREVPVPEPYAIEVERKFTLIERVKIELFWYVTAFAAACFGWIIRKPIKRLLRL